MRSKAEQTSLAAIAALVEARHEENIRRMDAMAGVLDQIGQDVKSLMATRTFAQGILKAVTVIATVVAAAVSTVLHYLRS